MRNMLYVKLTSNSVFINRLYLYLLYTVHVTVSGTTDQQGHTKNLYEELSTGTTLFQDTPNYQSL